MLLRPVRLTVVTAVLSGVVTLLVAVLPFLAFGYRDASAHTVIETVAALVALLAAYLVFGRFRESRRLPHLALAVALAILGTRTLFLSVLPTAIAGSPPEWRTLSGRFLGAAALAAAAFVPDVRVRRTRRVLAVSLGVAVLVVAATAIALAAVSDRLPQPVGPAAAPDATAWPRLDGHPAVLGVELAGALLFAVAAIGFARRAAATGDEFLTWVAAGATLGAFSRLNYFLFPSLYSDWIYTGDFFRLAFYLVLVLGAAREIAAYHRRLASAAAYDERRRLARDFHDGLAQELAFIATQSRVLAARGDARLLTLAHAAERALDEARSAISALTRTEDEPLEDAIADAAEEVARRIGGTRVEVNVPPGVAVPVKAREAVVRIVREAVANAARHGQASRVTIDVSADQGVRLRIRDDGTGFDPDAPLPSGGFGLRSMEERARAAGARFQVTSRRDEGTNIEVQFP